MDDVEKAKRTIDQWRLGQTSAKHESGGRGPETISTGRGDHGGVSYGMYQLSSKMEVVQKYLSGSRYKNNFVGLIPATPTFNAKWRELATKDPGFAQDQHDFIQRTHYELQVAKLRHSGIDLSDRGRAVRDALWSTSVQFGGETDVFQRGLEEKFGSSYHLAALSDRDIIDAVQDYKIFHVKKLFKSSPVLQESLLKRAREEKAELIELAACEELLARNDIHIPIDLPTGVVAQSTVEKRNIDHQSASYAFNQRLQETLNALGYADMHSRALEIDGHYGERTREAVASFQRHRGLSADGIAGPNTWAALQEATRMASTTPTMAPAIVPAVATEPSAVTFPRMAPSSDLDAVTLRALQQHLNTLGITNHHGQALSTTGVYDESTRTAVMTFQLEQRLLGTGAADPTTRALIEARAHIVELQQASRAHTELTHDAWLRHGPAHAPIMSSPSLPYTPPAATSPVTEQAPNGADPHNASMLEQQRLNQQRIQHQIVQEHQRLHDRAMQQREQEQKAAQERQNTAAYTHEAALVPDDMEDRQTIPHADHRERLATALWHSEPAPPPRVPATFADPDHPKHYRYEILLEQVQDAPALQSYTADQHARIAAGLTLVTDQHKAFVIQDMSSIEVKGSTLIATDHLKIGQASEVLHGNLSTMLAKTPEETASVWCEWALPKQATLPEAAQAVASDPHVVSRTDMRHPQESHHPMFLDARRKLGATYAHHGMTRDPEQLDREAALVTVTLRDRQMEAVPTLMLACEPDGRFNTRPGLCAVSDFSMVKLSGEDLTQAPPVAQSSQTLVQVEQRLHEQAVAFQQQWAQQAGLGRTP